ncbi:hypothetical protein HBI06_092950 [Parastagonospora nodorum]|nr:hypothetical protein HBI06_092950 [Parastagonospora nodorum]KAH4249410.1 hypothetical protein HBI05_004920 [Parastagonospora nodorum]KAH5437795.1 hypothetical protein HBI32_031290 [Parastagonospora nodorum]
MDDLLPSYENATNQDPWELVVQYLSSESLCAAALVCRRWHQIMAPQLWGNPASHFGVQNDTLYVALTRFRRVLPYVRESVRDLTHTLRFPPAHAEIYGGPHAEWLRDCLEYLPGLQCLLVNGLPFFDHSALLCLRYASLRRSSSHPRVFPMFGLRLLDASGCTNATSTGLTEALSHLPNLVSLDLSRTPATRDPAVLSKLRFLSSLRLLNLQGTSLKDADFDIVVSSIETRVRSLDVRDNHLTDASARALLERCLKEEPLERRTALGPLSPIEDERADGDLDVFESEKVVDHVRKKLTGGFVGSLTIERARDVGITHLYLSKNAMTVEGISGLLRSQRLQVLDIGTLPTTMIQSHPSGLGEAADLLQLPSVSKLTPVICEYASSKLRYLRINYEIVTEDAPKDAVTSPPRAELHGDLGRRDPSGAHELEAIQTSTAELGATDAAIYELPGDSGGVVELPGCLPTTTHHHDTSSNSLKVMDQSPHIEITAVPQEVIRGAAHAPEMVLSDTAHTSANVPKAGHNRNDLWVDGAFAGLSPTLTLGEESTNSVRQPTQKRSRHNSTYYVEDLRARLELRQSQENRLHPNMLPKVHTLVLTDIPTLSSNEEIVHRLIQYVKDAAEEVSIARERAGHTYALPPGRRRAIAEQEHARNLFALERIVLEMAPPQAPAKKFSTGWRAYPTKSSTEDADSEAFWDAATQDFSFFGEEECGLPDIEPGRTIPLAAMSGLELVTDTPAPRPQASGEDEFKPQIDVIAEIAKFRKERKAIYNNLLHMGETFPHIEGYWPGDITVVRKSLDQDAGELDFYGNRYQSGWHYR